MMRVASMTKLMSLCGVLLGLFLVYNVAPPLIAEGSDAVAGWVPCYAGQPCHSNMNLPCNGGDSGYGVRLCSGGGWFLGVSAGTGGHVVLYGNAGCGSGTIDDGYNCLPLRNSRCE